MTGVIVEGFLLGLSMGSYCALSCAPFIVPYLLSTESQGMGIKFSIFIQFIAGRFIAYIMFSIAVSIIGSTFRDVLTAKISYILLIIPALLMIILSIIKTFPKNPFCIIFNQSKWFYSFPIVTGFILGLNLCPPFIAGLVKVLAMDNMLKGVIYFIFLFIGSSIFLLPFPLLSITLKLDIFRRLGIYLGFLVGIWFLFQGITGTFL